MEDAIYKINEMSGIKASGSLVAGSEYETTDVIITIEDSKKQMRYFSLIIMEARALVFIELVWWRFK